MRLACSFGAVAAIACSAAVAPTDDAETDQTETDLPALVDDGPGWFTGDQLSLDGRLVVARTGTRVDWWGARGDAYDGDEIRSTFASLVHNGDGCILVPNAGYRDPGGIRRSFDVRLGVHEVTVDLPSEEMVDIGVAEAGEPLVVPDFADDGDMHLLPEPPPLDVSVGRDPDLPTEIRWEPHSTDPLRLGVVTDRAWCFFPYQRGAAELPFDLVDPSYWVYLAWAGQRRLDGDLWALEQYSFRRVVQ